MNAVQVFQSNDNQSECGTVSTEVDQPHSATMCKAAVLKSSVKPTLYPIDSEEIPEELKRLNRWLGWNWTRSDKADKWTKKPVNARTGRYGTSTARETWSSFTEAIDGVQTGRCDGIGIALGEDDGVSLAGVDVDDCRDVLTGNLSDIAKDIIATMDSYTEVSPSQTGVKIFCIVSEPPGKPTTNPERSVEIYSSARFFVVTGQHIKNTPATVENRQDELMTVWRKYIGDKQPAPATVIGPRQQRVANRTTLLRSSSCSNAAP